MGYRENDEDKRQFIIDADRKLREELGANVGACLDKIAAQVVQAAGDTGGDALNYRIRAAARITALAKSLRNGDFS